MKLDLPAEWFPCFCGKDRRKLPIIVGFGQLSESEQVQYFSLHLALQAGEARLFFFMVFRQLEMMHI
jgi:hypothetical protein